MVSFCFRVVSKTVKGDVSCLPFLMTFRRYQRFNLKYSKSAVVYVELMLRRVATHLVKINTVFLRIYIRGC